MQRLNSLWLFWRRDAKWFGAGSHVNKVNRPKNREKANSNEILERNESQVPEGDSEDRCHFALGTVSYCLASAANA